MDTSTEARDEAGRIRWRWALAGFAVLELVMIAAAVGWVAIYSHLLAPGRGLAVYQAHAARASPIVSLIAGLPAFWGAGRILLCRLGRDARRTALALAGTYVVMDALLIVAMTQDQRYNWSMAIASYLSKTGALYLGLRGLPRGG
jgi:hypothetical protein